MNNSSDTSSFSNYFTLAEFDFYGLYLHCSFVIEGFVMCFTNGLLLVTILAVKSLRKRNEMIIMFGMALADFILGSGAFFLGLYRVGLWITGHENESATNWECARLPPLFLINMGLQMTALMNFIVSIDRLYAVTWPQKYRTCTTKTAKKLIALVGVFFVASLSTMLLSSYIDDPPATQTRMCLGGQLKPWYSRFQFLFIISVEYLSVIVYVRVFILYKNILGKIAPSTLNEPHMFLQRRLTATMMITTASTFIFFILPMTTITLSSMNMISLPSASLLAFFTRISRIVNVSVYIFRQREVRRAMRKVLGCKCKSSQ